MSDISEDIKQAANEAYESYADGEWLDIRECIARAILAERERCAEVVREYLMLSYDANFGSLPDDLASAIRSPERAGE